MATYSLAAADIGAYDKTLAAATVDTVAWPAGAPIEWVRIINEGAAGIYITTDGTNPTVSGATTVKVPAGTFAVLKGPSDGAATVKLIAAAACAYSVSVSGAPR